jgi:uncharacterized protein (DUF924 family)
MTTAREILDFWIEETGPEGWYNGSEELDARIQERFGEVWDKAAAGEFNDWGCDKEAALALIVLLDQFPRNMFRGLDKAFSTDRKALCVAKKAIDKGFDLLVPEPQRQFFYMPLMHSESLTDQERCVRLMKTRMPETGAQNLVHARVHREVIRQFGRFPYRNSALKREMTAQEAAYLNNGGYGKTMQQVQSA